MSRAYLPLFALALCAAAGSDSLLQSAQSLPVSTFCVTADQCAALCRSFVEGGARAQDSLRRPPFDLGPPESFKPLPAAVSIPPVVDPSNVYSEVRPGNF